MVSHPHPKLIIGADLKAYFQDQVIAAAANQRMQASADTLHYLVNLLTVFSHAQALYEQTPDGPTLRPLALIYAEALEARTPEARHQALKRLGDVALFICGVFPNSLNRALVDVDYYIAMGGTAYGSLSEVAADTRRWQSQRTVFDELAAKFVGFVDVLNEVCEQSHLNNDRDVMRLYELWLRTGSARSAQKLRQIGLEPLAGSVSRRQH